MQKTPSPAFSYDRKAYYVIWNEPNIRQGWGGQPLPPGAYMSMLRAAYEGAEAGEPGAIIVSAPLAPTANMPDRALNNLSACLPEGPGGLALDGPGDGLESGLQLI
jgi:hypothetical protein